jgi:hypothetical protein
VINFGDIDELSAWLTAKGIDVSRWRSAGRKSVANLWDEIANGEAYIQDDPPLRVVNVTQVIVRKGNRFLREVEQEFGDGTRRSRDNPPSEKMIHDESCTEAALRCLKEELGINAHNVTFVTPECRQEQKVLGSPSYPGLLTQYTFYIVEANVEGLPDAGFWRDNAAFGQGDPIKRQRWVWRANPEC